MKPNSCFDCVEATAFDPEMIDKRIVCEKHTAVKSWGDCCPDFRLCDIRFGDGATVGETTTKPPEYSKCFICKESGWVGSDCREYGRHPECPDFKGGQS